MKFKYFCLAILLFPLTCLMAQNQTGNAREQVEAFRVAYYTRELNLTAEEAQVFWPVYNEYAHAAEANRQSIRRNQQSLKQALAGGSDNDVEGLLEDLLALKQAEVDLTLEYHNQFEEVLPIRKVALLYKAERDFKRKLLEHLQERRQTRRNNQNGRTRP